MKTVLVLILAVTAANFTLAQNEKLNIVVIGAHPDDADVDVGGTAIIFSRLGHNVLFVSLTNGDAGHFSEGGGTLAKRRFAETQEAGKRYGVTYKVLGNHDTELMPTLEVRWDIIKLIREWDADVVITHRPYDYHPDHRNTSLAVQDAAFLVTVPNAVPGVPALKKNPVFLYSSDGFKKPLPFKPDIAVDISDVYKQKMYGIAAHESQFFEWLPWLRGRLEQVPEDEKERLEWLAKSRGGQVSQATRESLIKWYGEGKAGNATHAEAFEICEYGSQPDDNEIKRLFPMLGN